MQTLARQAQEALAAVVGAAIVTVATGPLTAGWPAAAPYDFILLNGATEIVPETLGPPVEAGRPAGLHFRPAPSGKAMIYRMIEGHLVGRPIFDAAAPVLPGFAAAPAFVF